MRRNIFRLYDKVMGRYLEVAAFMHGREYGFKYIYCFPPDGIKAFCDAFGNEVPLNPLCGGTIGYKMTDIDRENIILEQWTGKGWAKVKPIIDSYSDEGKLVKSTILGEEEECEN